MNKLIGNKIGRLKWVIVFVAVFLLCGGMKISLAQEEGRVDLNALTQAFRDVKRARVVVRQTYGEADEVSLPFYEYAEKILNYAGLSVVEEDATTYDATISIEAKGIPDSAIYGAVSEFFGSGTLHWTKATVEGKISFSAGDKTFKWDFLYTEGPYRTVQTRYVNGRAILSYQTPNDAPFKAAFNGGFIPALFKAIAKVLGMPPLISALKDENSGVRNVAAAALEEINPKWRETEEAKRKVSEFISALKDEDKYGRKGAVIALGEIGDERAVEPLKQALKDKSKDVQIWAAFGLYKLGDTQKIEFLISALKDENSGVRNVAAAALEEINPKWRETEEAKRKVSEFISALKDEDEYGRKGAVIALGEIGDERAVEPLKQALKDKSKDVQIWAAFGLYKLGDTQKIEFLISALKNEDIWVRRAAAEALGELKDPHAVEPLISALKDEYWRVRFWAAVALKKITGKNFGEDEAKWRDWLGEE